MPKGVYTKKKCLLKRNNEFIPNIQQRNVSKYFPSSKYKGLLLYHKLGSGKTCTAILLADKMITNSINGTNYNNSYLNKIQHVFIITPGNLRANWIKEYCKICGFSSNYLKKYFTFITYNYNIINEVKKVNFNNSLVIIDEVHNLINGTRNNSKNKKFLYKKINDSHCKILALSGTPIYNNIDEWFLLGELLNPGYFKKFKQIKDIPVDNYKGIISYFPGINDFFPKVNYCDPIKTKMSIKQYNSFIKIYEQENIIKGRGPPTEKIKLKDPEKYKKLLQRFIMAISHIQSRAISNFYYESISGIQKKPDKLSKDGGWISKSILKNRKLFTDMSRKIAALISNIVFNINTKHVVYSFFKTKSGVNVIHNLLRLCNINSKIYSGDLDDKKRISLLTRFNDSKNMNGQKIKVLLITGAGSEGISLKEVNNLHILESDGKQLITQVIGRVIRYKSHYNMSKHRQYVNIWRYWSVSPANHDYVSIDEDLFNISQNNAKQINIFTKLLEKNSIENNNFKN